MMILEALLNKIMPDNTLCCLGSLSTPVFCQVHITTANCSSDLIELQKRLTPLQEDSLDTIGVRRAVV